MEADKIHDILQHLFGPSTLSASSVASSSTKTLSQLRSSSKSIRALISPQLKVHLPFPFPPALSNERVGVVDSEREGRKSEGTLARHGATAQALSVFNAPCELINALSLTSTTQGEGENVQQERSSWSFEVIDLRRVPPSLSASTSQQSSGRVSGSGRHDETAYEEANEGEEEQWHATIRWHLVLRAGGIKWIDQLSSQRVVTLRFAREDGEAGQVDQDSSSGAEVASGEEKRARGRAEDEGPMKLVGVEYTVPGVNMQRWGREWGLVVAIGAKSITTSTSVIIPLLYGLLLFFGYHPRSYGPSASSHHHHHRSSRSRSHEKYARSPRRSSATASTSLETIPASETSTSEISTSLSDLHPPSRSTLLSTFFTSVLASLPQHSQSLLQALSTTHNELLELFRAVRATVRVAVEITLGILGVGVEVVEEGVEEAVRERSREWDREWEIEKERERERERERGKRESFNGGGIVRSKGSLHRSPSLRKRVSFSVPGDEEIIPPSSSFDYPSLASTISAPVAAEIDANIAQEESGSNGAGETESILRSDPLAAGSTSTFDDEPVAEDDYVAGRVGEERQVEVEGRKNGADDNATPLSFSTLDEDNNADQPTSLAPAMPANIQRIVDRVVETTLDPFTDAAAIDLGEAGEKDIGPAGNGGGLEHGTKRNQEKAEKEQEKKQEQEGSRRRERERTPSHSDFYPSQSQHIATPLRTPVQRTQYHHQQHHTHEPQQLQLSSTFSPSESEIDYRPRERSLSISTAPEHEIEELEFSPISLDSMLVGRGVREGAEGEEEEEEDVFRAPPPTPISTAQSIPVSPTQELGEIFTLAGVPEAFGGGEGDTGEGLDLDAGRRRGGERAGMEEEEEEMEAAIRALIHDADPATVAVEEQEEQEEADFEYDFHSRRQRSTSAPSFSGVVRSGAAGLGGAVGEAAAKSEPMSRGFSSSSQSQPSLSPSQSFSLSHSYSASQDQSSINEPLTPGEWSPAMGRKEQGKDSKKSSAEAKIHEAEGERGDIGLGLINVDQREGRRSGRGGNGARGGAAATEQKKEELIVSSSTSVASGSSIPVAGDAGGVQGAEGGIQSASKNKSKRNKGQRKKK